MRRNRWFFRPVLERLEERNPPSDSLQAILAGLPEEPADDQFAPPSQLTWIDEAHPNLSRLRETDSSTHAAESKSDPETQPETRETKQQAESPFPSAMFTSALLDSWFDESLASPSLDSAADDFAAYAPMVLPAAGAQGDASAPTPTNSAPFRNPTATSEPERQATDATTQFVPEADGDGVAATTEFAAPNRGDGNADGVLDSLQADVASLQAATNGEFVTLESAGHSLRNVTAVDPASPSLALRANSPSLPYGLFDFEIHDVTPGGSATVRMILPDDAQPTGYLKYDPASGALDPFQFDGSTGAEIDGNVITLHFVDGGRGDADGVANGVIVDPGGGTGDPVTANDDSFTVQHDRPLVIYPEGLLENDINDSGMDVIALLVTEPTHGSVNYASVDVSFAGVGAIQHSRRVVCRPGFIFVQIGLRRIRE